MNPNTNQTISQPQVNQTPASIPPAPPETKNKIKSLMLLEVGLLEVGLILLILIIFFGILNYFNVLSLSSLYPNQLGFLPHTTKVTSPPVQTQAVMPSSQLYNADSAKKVIAGKQLATEATDEQIASYMNLMQKQFPTPTPIVKSSPEDQNITGILSGFDNNYFQIIESGATSTNFSYDINTSFASSSNASAGASANDLLFVPANSRDLLDSKNFGKTIQVQYNATISSYLKAVIVSF